VASPIGMALFVANASIFAIRPTTSMSTPVRSFDGLTVMLSIIRRMIGATSFVGLASLGTQCWFGWG
jgi:hypothetical protein